MAKKRYYQSKKDRRAESRGMKEYWSDMSKPMKHPKGSTLAGEPSKLSGQPMNPVIKHWPMDYSMDRYGYADSLPEIEGVLYKASGMFKKQKSKKRF